jgi:hypothetical protein
MENTTPQIDYGAVLADLKAQREKIDAAIAGIETMLGMKPLSSFASQEAQKLNDLVSGNFLGMTIVDATVKFLRAKRANQRTEDILSALKDGGIAFRSANPINTVGSVLYRDWLQGGELVRVSRGMWGLAEWHPRLRKRSNVKNGSTEAEPSVDSSEEPT